MHHTFLKFVPVTGDRPVRHLGVLIASETGPVTAYAAELLHERGVLFVRPGDKVYAGQVIGEANRNTDLTVNIARQKKLDNMRVANKEATVTLKAPRDISLEQALEYIEEDELVELTPTTVRLRKVNLSESVRKRDARIAKSKALAED